MHLCADRQISRNKLNVFSLSQFLPRCSCMQRGTATSSCLSVRQTRASATYLLTCLHTYLLAYLLTYRSSSLTLNLTASTGFKVGFGRVCTLQPVFGIERINVLKSMHFGRLKMSYNITMCTLYVGCKGNDPFRWLSHSFVRFLCESLQTSDGVNDVK